MEPMALGALFPAGRGLSIILIVTGGIAAAYGVLEFIGIAPRRDLIGGQKLGRRTQGLVIVLIGVALVVLGLVLP